MAVQCKDHVVVPMPCFPLFAFLLSVCVCVDVLQVGSSLLPVRPCGSQVVGRPPEQETGWSVSITLNLDSSKQLACQ